MPNITWEEISELVHAVREERIIVIGAKVRLQALYDVYKEDDLMAAIDRLSILDRRLNQLEVKLMEKILNHEDEDK